MSTDSNIRREIGKRDELHTSGVSGRKLRAHGLRTRELIVQEAKNVLLQGGPLEFSLRTVARRAKISISNLQYYFPTRAALMRSIMDPVVVRYTDEYAKLPSDAAAARQMLHRLIDQTLTDVRSPEVGPIWLHFASLAVTDPESARMLDESYVEFTRGASRLLRIINPSLTGKQSETTARLILALIDGLVFQIGAGHRAKTSMTSLDRYAHDAVNLLIG